MRDAVNERVRSNNLNLVLAELELPPGETGFHLLSRHYWAGVDREFPIISDSPWVIKFGLIQSLDYDIIIKSYNLQVDENGFIVKTPIDKKGTFPSDRDCLLDMNLELEKVKDKSGEGKLESYKAVDVDCKFIGRS